MRVAGKIFVNYRRDDAKAEAARLHDRLAQSFGAGGVFMDVDNLLPGERFDLRLKEALAGTDVFLAVIGGRWLELLEARAESGERDYVREEIAAALAAKLVVIPVLMDRAALPKAASLPEDIRELALYHKHDVVYESFGRDVQALIGAIEAHRQALDEKAAEAARLAREQRKAEIEATFRAGQKAKEEAEAQRRAQEKEKQAGPRPEPASMPWKAAAGIVAVAVAVVVLIAQPWRGNPAAPQGGHTAEEKVINVDAAARGAVVFSRCKMCHKVGPGAKNSVGPEQNSLIGARAGSRPGYSFSAVMKAAGESGIVWTEENLDRFLDDPKAFVPGTKMVFPGLKNAQDRADLIEFLKTQTSQ